MTTRDMTLTDSRAATTVCNSPTKHGGICDRPAGWGTDHPGEGRCKLHGGASPRGIDSPHFKHGLDSKYRPYVRQQLRDKLDLLNGTDPLDIEDEALLLRAVLMDLLDRDKADYSDTARITALLDQITRTAERMNRMRNDTAITAAEVAFIAARAAHVVTEHISDPERQAAFLRDLLDAFGMA